MRVTNQRLSRPTANTKQIRKNEEKKGEAYFTGKDEDPRMYPGCGLQSVRVWWGWCVGLGGVSAGGVTYNHFKIPE